MSVQAALPRRIRHTPSSQTPLYSPHGEGEDVSRLRTYDSFHFNGSEMNGEPDVGYSGNNVHNSETLTESMEGFHKVGIRDRICQFTWTWFTMSMATGGMASTLHAVPFRSEWLRIVGVILALLNITLFLINCTVITLRFKFDPGSFRASFTNPAESLFISCSIVSLGTIFINICQYGISHTGEWLALTMAVMYWVYTAVSLVSSVGIYITLWSTTYFPIHSMTPIWIFPAYPLLLSGPFAANLLSAVPNATVATRINSPAIALTAVSIQGTGFMVSLMIYSAFIYRLMTRKLPLETTRPGVFVSIGPSGFTVAGIVHLGNNIREKVLPVDVIWFNTGSTDAAFVLKILADIAGLWIWGLCIWFFLVSIGSHWTLLLNLRENNEKHRINFAMTWYSFVFPNTALITATQAIGRTFNSRGIQIFGCVLTGILFVVWLAVFGLMIRALVRKRILWPADVGKK